MLWVTQCRINKWEWVSKAIHILHIVIVTSVNFFGYHSIDRGASNPTLRETILYR